MADQRISIDSDAGALTGAELVPLVRVGSPVTAGSFSIGEAYVILSIGTTNFTLIGAASNTVGVGFVATGVGSGTGTAGITTNVRSTTLTVAGQQATFVGDSGSGGTKGAVPAPGAGDAAANLFLSAAGGWASSYIYGWHYPVSFATTAPLSANTYNNGTAGVGATLTGNSNGALGSGSPPEIDGISPVVGYRLLVKDEVAAANNGIYVVTQVGDGSHPYILTRATDFDSVNNINQADVVVVGPHGTTNGAEIFQVSASASPIVVGTTGLTWASVTTSVGGTLAGDTDVLIGSPANNDFLEYQTSDSLWHNRTPTQATAALIAVVGDSGSGGTKGLVPAPGSGDAAAGKFLKADGTFAVPSGGTTPPTSSSTGLTNWANQGSASVADTTKGISINAPSNGGAQNWRLRYKAVPSTPFAIKARVALTNDFVNNHYAFGGIGFYDGTKLEGITLELSNTTSTQIGYTTNATVGISTGNTVLDIIAVPNPIWLGLYDDGTNVGLGFSVDGADFITIHSATLPDFLSAMTDVYFGLNPYGSAASIVMLDYIELAGSVTSISGGFRF